MLGQVKAQYLKALFLGDLGEDCRRILRRQLPMDI